MSVHPSRWVPLGGEGCPAAGYDEKAGTGQGRAKADQPANRIAETPTPPYYAVVFTSVRTEIDEGYAEIAAAMDELAAKQPGYLGEESAREGVGITVSYWRDLESITAWTGDKPRCGAKARPGTLYATYRVRIALVERDYGFTARPSTATEA